MPKVQTPAGFSYRSVFRVLIVQFMDALSLDAIGADGSATFTVRLAGADQKITAAPGAWTKGALTLGDGPVSGGSPTAIAASGAWTAPDTYTLQVVQYRTPFAATYRLQFAGNELRVECEQNVSFSEQRVSRWVGRAQPAAMTSSK